MSFGQTLRNLALTGFIIYGLLKFLVVPAEKDFSFHVDNHSVKYHSNWTDSFADLKNLDQLTQALTLPSIDSIDISLAMSSLNYTDIMQIFKAPFRKYKQIKLNLGNVQLGTKGTEYVLSLIPNGVEHLELYLDSISADDNVGQALASRLNELTSLKKLKLSLILAAIKDKGVETFFNNHKIGQNLKDLRLVLIGNQLNETALTSFPHYLQGSSLDSFGLNLYANNIKAAGAHYIAQGLKLISPRDLDLDFYFNNITEEGTANITQSIVHMDKLERVSLNFDFNYIKNEGAKEIGLLMSKLHPLKQINIGVASKNFGYLGFKSLIQGLSQQKNVTHLTLRCGVNRVGINGAAIVNKMISQMTQLQTLHLGFVQNYIGDDGLSQISETVTKIPTLRNLELDLAFNDAKGHGGINSLKFLSSRPWDSLSLRLSHNQFRDPDVKLMKPHISKLLKTNKNFVLEFMDTAVSKSMKAELEKLFEPYLSESVKLFINSVIPEDKEEAKSAEL